MLREVFILLLRLKAYEVTLVGSKEQTTSKDSQLCKDGSRRWELNLTGRYETKYETKRRTPA